MFQNTRSTKRLVFGLDPLNLSRSLHHVLTLREWIASLANTVAASSPSNT